MRLPGGQVWEMPLSKNWEFNEKDLEVQKVANRSLNASRGSNRASLHDLAVSEYESAVSEVRVSPEDVAPVVARFLERRFAEKLSATKSQENQKNYKYKTRAHF